ncbi:MAG: hypothetical protein MJY42_03950 [Bacteroidales bacterium]|nr:hypothetical protein [Bacteroidales bacterium]
MKTVAVLVALSTGIASFARTSGDRDRSADLTEHWASIGWGGYPWVQFNNFIPGLRHSDYAFSTDTPVKDIYTDYFSDFRSTGTISGEFGWNIGRWFSTDIDLSLTPLWTDKFNGDTGTKISTVFACAIQLMPEARLMYVNRSKFKFYSSLGVGVAIYPGSYEEQKVQPAIQVNPLGFEFGGKVFGSAKFGIGTEFFGLKLGVGYRF